MSWSLHHHPDQGTALKIGIGIFVLACGDGKLSFLVVPGCASDLVKVEERREKREKREERRGKREERIKRED